MAQIKITENVKGFIFEYIDSVEQLEVLLFVRKNCERDCSAEEISSELRSSVTSVNVRLLGLKKSGLIADNKNLYRYSKNTKEIEDAIDALTEDYKVRRHLVLELIFSPLKKMRKFADSFVFSGQDKKKGDDEDG